MNEKTTHIHTHNHRYRSPPIVIDEFDETFFRSIKDEKRERKTIDKIRKYIPVLSVLLFVDISLSFYSVPRVVNTIIAFCKVDRLSNTWIFDIHSIGLYLSCLYNKQNIRTVCVSTGAHIAQEMIIVLIVVVFSSSLFSTAFAVSCCNGGNSCKIDL